MEHLLEVRVKFGDCHSEKQYKNEGDSEDNMTSIQCTSNTVPNSSEDEEEREKFLKNKIRKRDVKTITRVITPLALTGCKTNALLMAMEVCFMLRRLAANKRPDEKELMMVANNVEDFAFCLLDALETDSDYISKYEGFLAEVLDAAIGFHQKKLLIHPVLYNFTNYKWHGKFEGMKRRSKLESQRWKWFFLNFWCIIDVVLFPFIFTLCFLFDNVKERFLGPKDLVIKLLVMDGVPYSIGDQIAKFVHRKFCRRKVTWSWVDPQEPCLHGNRAWSNADKVLVVCSNQNFTQENDEDIQHYKRCGFKIIPIPVRFDKVKCIGNESGVTGTDQLRHKIGNRIISEMNREAMYGCYLEYFTTPYFVFVRDTLSYLAFLGLHLAVCLAPPSIKLSGLEWAILILFTGRLVMTLETFNNFKVLQTDDRGGFQSILRARIGKYISDPSNILDIASVLVYFPTIALRIFISLISQSVADNRALAISGYMYGFLTILVVLRLLNQLLEKGKGVGAVQIAFFNIIQDVCAVLLQFAATIMAFSIGMTKVFIAEKYRINSGRNETEHACKEGSSAILCWWLMVKHLAWSSVGATSLDRLPLVDDYPSMLLVYLLYGAFLISAVVLLLNMVIALLCSTYQRISDNSLSEWSFKRAIALQTYNALQPIPVPYNLAAFLVRFCLHCIRRRLWKGNGEETQKTTQENGANMDMVVKELQQKYFEKYGSDFPRTAQEINTIRTNCQRARGDDYSGSRDHEQTEAAMGNDEGGFPVTVQKIGVRSKLFSQMKDLKELRDTGLMPTNVFEQQKLIILKEITELAG